MKDYKDPKNLYEFAIYGREYLLDQNTKGIVIVEQKPSSSDSLSYRMFREMPKFSDWGWHADASTNSKILLALVSGGIPGQAEDLADAIHWGIGQVRHMGRNERGALIQIVKD